MKTFFLLTLLVLVSADNILNFHHGKRHHDDEFNHHQQKEFTIEDFKFMNKVFYSIYSGFVEGLYRAPSNPISNECFGDWIAQNLTHMSKVFDNMTNGTFPTFEEAK